VVERISSCTQDQSEVLMCGVSYMDKLPVQCFSPENRSHPFQKHKATTPPYSSNKGWYNPFLCRKQIQLKGLICPPRCVSFSDQLCYGSPRAPQLSAPIIHAKLSLCGHCLELLLPTSKVGRLGLGVLFVVVVDGRLDGILCEHAAMQLNGRQALRNVSKKVSIRISDPTYQLLCNLGVLHL